MNDNSADHSGNDPRPLPGQLDRTGRRLAILDILHRPAMTERTVSCAIEALWREDREDVIRAFDEAILVRLDDVRGDGNGRHGLRAERMRELRRPFPRRDRKGLTVAELAERAGLSHETTARLLEANGYLETNPFGGRQNRRLVSQAVFEAGHGHNVDPSATRSLVLDGGARSAPFPVFYEEHADDITWSLGWDAIVETTANEPSKKARLTWLLREHPYLPDEALATLAGYSRLGVIQARKRSGNAASATAMAA